MRDGDVDPSIFEYEDLIALSPTAKFMADRMTSAPIDKLRRNCEMRGLSQAGLRKDLIIRICTDFDRRFL